MHTKDRDAQKQEDPAQQSYSLPCGQRDRVGCQAPLWMSKHPKGGRDITCLAEDEKMVSWKQDLCVVNAKRCF